MTENSNYFSRNYINRELLSDSKKFRIRLEAWFFQILGYNHIELENYGFAIAIHRDIGVRVPSDRYSNPNYELFFMQCKITELLDFITFAYGFFVSVSEEEKIEKDLGIVWLECVKDLFQEECLHYRIDDYGGIHFFIDEEFIKEWHSALDSLKSPRYATAKQAFLKLDEYLLESPPNFRKAIREVFEVLENIFKQNFPKELKLNAKAIESSMKPKINSLYSSESKLAKITMDKSLQEFKVWVDTAHFYRHAQGESQPMQIPAELGVLLLSKGICYLRWMISLDSKIRTCQEEI